MGISFSSSYSAHAACRNAGNLAASVIAKCQNIRTFLFFTLLSCTEESHLSWHMSNILTRFTYVSSTKKDSLRLRCNAIFLDFSFRRGERNREHISFRSMYSFFFILKRYEKSSDKRKVIKRNPLRFLF